MSRDDARLGLPDLGVGVGLRVPHYRHILSERPEVDFFEVISENFMRRGGRPRYHLERVLESYRVVQHGVSLGIGGPEKPSREYLEALKRLCRRTGTPWVSDHFCWSGAGNAHLHDLLPLPYTREALDRVVERAREIQDFLEVPFALENTSSYLTYRSSTLSEWEFISEIAERANIGLLFDVNNVFVSAYNHGFDPVEFVKSVPHRRIVQIHLAGHTNLGKYLIDTHRGEVSDPVWTLYELTVALTGRVSTLIEWDDQIPEFPRLAAEAERAREAREQALVTNVDDPDFAARLERVRMSARAPERAELTVTPGWLQGGPREMEHSSP
jgi:uncharacterized protein (UPF0276 family)